MEIMTASNVVNMKQGEKEGVEGLPTLVDRGDSVAVLAQDREELIEAVAENLEEFDQMMKPTKKELAKLFVSGFVSGCSGVFISSWLKPFNISFHGPKAVDTVVNTVAKYGLTSIVTNRVMKDTKEGLDAVDEMVEIYKIRRKAKKILAKEQKAKKDKYVRVKED